MSLDKKITIALVGNPNCGKTTAFNRMTGTHQKVGNWTGVTVEKKEGVYKKNKNIIIVDLPGIYSLSAKSEDEAAVLRFFKENSPDVIINVVDGTNLERNLFLTHILLGYKIPVVVAVNFSDELKKRGEKINFTLLSEKLGVPVVAVSALKGEGIDNAIKLAVKNAKEGVLPQKTKYSSFSIEEKYAQIEKIISDCSVRTEFAYNRTEKIDKIALHGFWGLIVFIVVMTAVYALSVKFGGVLSVFIENLFDFCALGAQKFLSSLSAPLFLKSLSSCVFSGFKSVFSLLPHILIMFFMLTLLEQSGYMARVAYLCDGLLCRFGLGGKSAIPMILASGCTVTGLMATRTIENVGERERTITALTFIPCGAKAAVISYFTHKFFGGKILIAVSLYFFSLIVSLAVAKFMKRRSKNTEEFLIELPPYRAPSVKDVFFVLLEKIKEFTVKAGTLILAVSVILWCLKSFNFNGYTEEVSQSFLYYLGEGLKYLLYPVGVKSWECAVSVLTGMLAREAIVETLEIVATDVSVLFGSPFEVYAFIVFALFLPPCVASMFQLKKELGDKRRTIKILSMEIFVAYFCAACVNLIGYAFLFCKGLLFLPIVVIIIALCIKPFKKLNCSSCGKCLIGNKCFISKGEKMEKKTLYDLMRETEVKEEDALYPEEIISSRKPTDREKYFEYYDDVKTSIKEDW